jgi:uncharacterized membrane protein
VWIAFGLVAVHAAIFMGALVLRHRHFSSEQGGDTAYYNQILWSTLHGEFFRGSVTQERYFSPPVFSEFALHNSPILLLVLPLYSLFPSFYTLLILKNLLLSAGGMAIYLLAKDKLGGPAGIVIMVGYFISAGVFYQSINAFYPLLFVFFFLPFTFLYYFRERFWPFVLWLILSLSVREEVALTTVLFGAYAVLLRRSWRWIVTPVVLSGAWWVLSTEVVMVRSRIAMEELVPFYEMFGGGHNRALIVAVENPGKFTSLFLNSNSAAYVYEVLKPTALLSLLSASGIFLLPTLLTNCLIGAFMPTMMSIGYHYSAIAAVCVFVALIMGIARVVKSARLDLLEQPVVSLGLAFLLIPFIVLGLKDRIQADAQGKPFLRDVVWPSPDQRVLEKIVAKVPIEASVAAPNILMPDLSYRRKLYGSERLWRYNNPHIDYIILDTRLEQLGANDRNKSKYEAVVMRTRNDSNYHLIFEERGFEVYQRTSGTVW